MKLGNIISTVENLAGAQAEEELQAQETATAVAEENGELAQAEIKIEGEGDAIDDAFEAGDKVAELTDVAEASLGEDGEDGEGLTESEAAMVQITHESIMASIGMPFDRKIFTSESFSSSAARRDTTVATIEGLMDSAKELGSKIVAALKAALSTVMNFIAGLLKNRALMDKHLVNLQAKVAALKDGKAKKDTLTAGAKALSVGGKASPETAKVQLKNALQVVEACAKMAEAMKSKDLKPTAQGALAGLSKNGNGVGVLSNDRSIIVGDGEEVKFELAQVAEPAKEIAAPTPAQMSELLKEARIVLAKLRDMEKTQTRMKDAVQAVIARLGEGVAFVKSKVGSEESKAKASEDLQAKKDARAVRSLLTAAGGKLPGAVFATVKGVADYVTAGLNNYGAEKAADAK